MQSTALLEFSLLKDGAITQNLISRIDKILKGNSDVAAIVSSNDEKTDSFEPAETKTTNDQEVSITELFSSLDDDTLISSNTSDLSLIHI